MVFDGLCFIALGVQVVSYSQENSALKERNKELNDILEKNGINFEKEINTDTQSYQDSEVRVEVSEKKMI